MKIIKKFTFASLAAVAAMLLFQTAITQADDHGQQGDHGQRINKRFVILLAGVYEHVGHAPKDNLGLVLPHLNNGKYQKVKIYAISGLPGDNDEDKAIGTFYVLGGEGLCAYDLPGGAFTAKFTGTQDVVEQLPPDPVPPGVSWTDDGTIQLDILEATGIYRSFVGGHIHMVDILKFRAGDGTLLEDCFCHIHPKLVAP